MLQKIADAVRVISAETVEKSGSGHPGMPMGCAEIGAHLFSNVLKYNPEKPKWINRDRLFLSAGHGSLWLYVLLHLSGYDLDLEDLKQYRKFDSKTPSHPEYGRTPGAEMTTGPLGQGFASAVGAAAAEEILAKKYNRDDHKLLDHYTYVLAGDGDLMEGISYEAASLAGSLNLSKLIVIYDSNGISIDGPTDLTFIDDIKKRFSAVDWQVIDNIDGSNFKDLEYAFRKAKDNKESPSIIIADTIIGKGAPAHQGKSSAHASPLGKKEIDKLKENLGWSQGEFFIPDSVYNYFKKHKRNLENNYKQWMQLEKEYKELYPELYQEFKDGIQLNLNSHIKDFEVMFKDNKAPRDFSGEYFRYFADQLPYLISGSADLSGSTRLKLNKYKDINGGNFSGRSLKFGVREHAMAGAASGMMLHKGLRPVISTYLSFSDYMRPSIRLAAMMNLPVIYVFTHDSIYVGEDGPTHQPIEQLESLRLIPNLRVIRPADEKEVRYTWRNILEENNKPTALILARQRLDKLDNQETSYEEFCRGAYILKDYEKQNNDKKKIVILASGSELSLAVRTANIINNTADIKIISVPERNKLEKNQQLAEKLIGEYDLAVTIEAGVKTGWYQIVDKPRLIFGIEDFGISGSGEKNADHFGLKAEKIAEKIANKLELQN
jgi:transketolase